MSDLVKKPKAWERQVQLGESQKAHELFLEYHALGLDRSVPKLAEKTGKPAESLSALSFKFKWVPRAIKYDQYLIEIRQRAIENQTKTEAILWAEREAQYRHEAYSFSEKLWARAQEMLDSPLYEEKVEKKQKVEVGGEVVEVNTVVIRKPVRWNMKTALETAELSDKMRRLSLGVPTSRSEINLNVNQDSIDERLEKARAAMNMWIQTRLEAAIDRLVNFNPEMSREDAKQQLLSELPIWFAADYKLPSPTMLLTEGDDEPEASEPPVEPLQLEEEVVH